MTLKHPNSTLLKHCAGARRGDAVCCVGISTFWRQGTASVCSTSQPEIHTYTLIRWLVNNSLSLIMFSLGDSVFISLCKKMHARKSMQPCLGVSSHAAPQSVRDISGMSTPSPPDNCCVRRRVCSLSELLSALFSSRSIIFFVLHKTTDVPSWIRLDLSVVQALPLFFSLWSEMCRPPTSSPRRSKDGEMWWGRWNSAQS